MQVEFDELVFKNKPKHHQFKDLEGLKFGYLSVLGYTGKKDITSSNNHYWGCICDCGKYVETKGVYLTTGETISCGHVRGENISTNELEKFKILYFNKFPNSKLIIKGPYLGKYKEIIVEDKYGECVSTPYRLLVEECSPTIKTALNKNEYALNQIKEIHGDKYSYPNFNYIKNKSKILIVCEQHGEFIQRFDIHIIPRGCSKCGEELKSDFSKDRFIKLSKNKEVTLYIIRCFNENEEFDKIGITSKSIEDRFRYKSIFPYNYEILFNFVDKPNIIWDLEKELHKKYKEFKYTPQIKFNGHTECFSRTIKIN